MLLENTDRMTMAAPQLDIVPATELTFTLSQSESTPRCQMTLTHPGGAVKESIAFKVKTTQPRRYLVRPNQGLIAPGQSESVQIILVEKDKNALLQSYQRLGQSALDHSKDKFLVQSCTVSSDFAKNYHGDAGYEALTTFWSQVTSASNTTPVANKKLHVRHVVAGDTPAAEIVAPAVDGMNREELVAEMSNLRRKYDELVAFSVNLTAERDILNNTLEQTKRDLNAQVLAAKRGGRGAGGTAASPTRGISIGSVVFLIVVALLMGMRLESMGHTKFLRSAPVIGKLLGNGGSEDGGGAPEQEL